VLAAGQRHGQVSLTWRFDGRQIAFHGVADRLCPLQNRRRQIERENKWLAGSIVWPVVSSTTDQSVRHSAAAFFPRWVSSSHTDRDGRTGTKRARAGWARCGRHRAPSPFVRRKVLASHRRMVSLVNFPLPPLHSPFRHLGFAGFDLAGMAVFTISIVSAVFDVRPLPFPTADQSEHCDDAHGSPSPWPTPRSLSFAFAPVLFRSACCQAARAESLPNRRARNSKGFCAVVARFAGAARGLKVPKHVNWQGTRPLELLERITVAGPLRRRSGARLDIGVR